MLVTHLGASAGDVLDGCLGVDGVPADDGQLRHSSLTHLGEPGASAILIQAESRHQDPRTLARSAEPAFQLVAALTAEFDRRRRH